MNKFADTPGGTELLPYVTPSIVTLSEEQILEEIGPARAYTGAMPFSF